MEPEDFKKMFEIFTGVFAVVLVFIAAFVWLVIAGA